MYLFHCYGDLALTLTHLFIDRERYRHEHLDPIA
jgi:hypothetical protein